MTTPPTPTPLEATRNLTVLNAYGLYARCAAMFVKTVMRYAPGTEVSVTCNGATINGHSIMGLMTMEAYQGTVLTVKAVGAEARTVIEELTRMFNAGFNTDGACLPVPKAHSEFLEDQRQRPPWKPAHPVRIMFALNPCLGAERKHLVRVILPKLRSQCRRQGIRLIAMDLQRGAKKFSGPISAGALETLDETQPFFLVLSGEHALHLLGPDRIPDKVADMRRLMESIRASRHDSADEINVLLRCYPWNKQAGAYLRRADISEEEAGIIRSLFSRSAAYRRAHSLIVLSREHEMMDTILSAQLPESLKQQADDAGLPYVESDNLETFSVAVLGILSPWLDAEGKRVSDRIK